MFKKIRKIIGRKQPAPRKSISELMYEEGQRARLAGVPIHSYIRPVTFSTPVVASAAAYKEAAWRKGWHHMDEVLASEKFQINMFNRRFQ